MFRSTHSDVNKNKTDNLPNGLLTATSEAAGAWTRRAETLVPHLKAISGFPLAVCGFPTVNLAALTFAMADMVDIVDVPGRVRFSCDLFSVRTSGGSPRSAKSVSQNGA